MSTTADPAPTTSPPRPTIPRTTAALIGVVAAAAAVGVGHLVAAFVAPSSSPFVAVGDAVIRLSPPALTEWAIRTFGESDRLVLLVGISVVIAVIAVVAGLASRSRPGPGFTVVAVLGLVGVAAVLFSPGFTALGLVAPVLALLTGLGAFTWMHSSALRIPAAGGDGAVSRRTLLIGTGAIGVGALAAGAVGLRFAPGVEDSRARVTARLASAGLAETAPAIPAGAEFPDLPTPSFITPNDEFYRVDTAALRIPTSPAETWSMRIHGMVDREITLTFDDLMSRPLVERTITLTCVSNPVGGPYTSTADFVGVELRDILMEAGIRPGADQIFTTSADNWTCGTPVADVMEPDRGALIAIGMNGEALPPIHGFPVRMVVPGLYGFVSATKWLTDMEITTFEARQAYWLQRDWGQFAPIKTQSRIDTPASFEQVPAGQVAVAGIAWSQPDGIERVEVRLDDGPWQETELAAAVNPDTWRHWRTDLDLAPGTHTVQVRATDGNGVTQTDERVDPIPDGATGWQSIFFTAT